MFDKEPALIIGAFRAIMILAVSFGLNLTNEQMGAIIAVISVAMSIWTRSKVYSPDTVANIISSPTKRAEVKEKLND